MPAGRTYCALCSRLRRGHLYRIAREEGCAAVVLGHHRDDIVETFLLNLFHGGQLAAMPPKLLNDDGDLYVLRPLALVAEADCARFARAMGYPIIPCDLCGSQDGLQRAAGQAHARRLGGGEPRPPADPVPRADPGRARATCSTRRSSISRPLTVRPKIRVECARRSAGRRAGLTNAEARRG